MLKYCHSKVRLYLADHDLKPHFTCVILVGLLLSTIKSPSNMDWALCIVQQPSNEALKCPLNGPGSADKSGPYLSFLSRVCTFRELDVLPLPITHLTEHVTVDDMVFN